MGYDFHVTRAEHWSSNEDQEILAGEWLDLVGSDPELVPAPENGQYFVIWRGTTKYPETWFNWDSGSITTKNPDKATLRKMLEIATRLSARVQGDEGEMYDEAAVEVLDDSFLDSNSHPPATDAVSPNKRASIFVGCSDKTNPCCTTQVQGRASGPTWSVATVRPRRFSLTSWSCLLIDRVEDQASLAGRSKPRGLY